MKKLINVQIETKDGLNVVSSRVIAEQLGKEHKNVKRDLEKILKEVGSDLSAPKIIESEYKDICNRTQKEYLLTKDGFTLYMFNIQGYNDFKIAYISKFNEMEKALKEVNTPKLPSTYKEALIELLAQVEKNEKLELENAQQKQQIGELKPKADYTDIILKSNNTVTITQIAKDYGKSGQEMNKILNKMKIQYKQSNQWLLYSKYHNCGYTKSVTNHYVDNDGNECSKLHTKWTQKGRLFLYGLLKENGIIPLIEQ